MKDQLHGYLHPTADMRKAIDRNAKQDEDLSLALKQIDKEKRVALDLLSRKQDAFKKQQLKRRETLANNSKVQLFDQGTAAVRDRPRPQQTDQENRVRRTMSCEETRLPSVVHIPTVVSKRYSLPASVFRHEEGQSLSFTAEGKVTSLRHTENASIRSSKNVKQRDEKPIKEDTLTQNYATQSAIRRHSAIIFQDGSMNNNVAFLPRRRRLTIHSFARSSIEHEKKTLITL